MKRLPSLLQLRIQILSGIIASLRTYESILLRKQGKSLNKKWSKTK